MFLSHHGLIFGSLQALCQVAKLLNGLSYVLHIARHLLLSKYVDLSLVLSQQGLKFCLPANTHNRVLNYTSPEKFTIEIMDQSCGIPITTVCCSNLNLKSTPHSLAPGIYIHTVWRENLAGNLNLVICDPGLGKNGHSYSYSSTLMR